MKSISNIILILNITLIILMFVTSYFWIQIGLTENEHIYLGLACIVIFGLAMSGFFTGVVERKERGKITRIGIIGNLILTLILLTAIISLSIEMNKN